MEQYVILDRDGTINVERHYLSSPEGVELLPGAAEGLRRMRALGFGLIVATNQSGVARGYFDETRLAEIHHRLRDLLAIEGVALDRIYYCPHAPDERCGCRKPAPGLVLRAARELGFDPRAAVVIGDTIVDVALGRTVGATTILVTTGEGKQTQDDLSVRPDFVVADLIEAAVAMERRMRPAPAGTRGDGSL